MAVPTLAQLLSALTPAQIRAALLAKLQSNGMPITDWSSGAPERTLVESEADSQEGQWALVPDVASGGHIDLATGAWLTWLAFNRYNLTRVERVATVGTIRLTCSAAAGPYTITNNTLEFQGAGGNLYTNTAGAGVLASGGTIDLTITARSPGADEGNDGATTITTMTTPLAGVTCTNPASTFSAVTLDGLSTGTVVPSFGTPESASWVVLITLTGQRGVAEFKLSSDGGLTYGIAQVTAASVVAAEDADGPTGLTLAFANGASNPSYLAGDSFSFSSQGTWYTTQGADGELEGTTVGDESLRQRCKARWPEQSETPTDDVYTAMCKRASASATKVRVAVDGVVPAQVNITIAGPNGTVSGPRTDPATVAYAVQQYVVARKAFTDVPLVTPAGTFAVTLAGATVRVRGASLARAQAAAQRNVAAYLATCGIGDGSTAFVRYSQVVEAILRESGDEDDSVAGLTVNASGTDVLITANAVATWSQQIATALTWTPY